NYDRNILDDLNDILHRGIIGVESLMGEINSDYQLYFFPLEGEELIDTIVNSLNLTIDLNIQDFEESIGPYKAEIVKPDLTKPFEISKSTYAIIHGYLIDNGYLTEEQWEDFLTYFNFETVDEISEVTIKYDKFEDLLKRDPNALDKMWEMFDDVGIEGIYETKDIKKTLPNSWEKTGKYLQIGGYIIDIAVVIDGIKNNDWGEIGGVVGSMIGSEIGAAVVAIFTPYKWISAMGAIVGGIAGTPVGKKIGDSLQDYNEDYTEKYNQYHEDGDSMLETRIKIEIGEGQKSIN
ncbi:MAG: hypothetical protein ACK5HR_06350, partial [Mycoplasmatales bacterium]